MNKNNNIVYVGMTADVIHPGLINIINIAASHGKLIIGLLTDSAIIEYKRLPYLSYDQRKQILENINGVNKVVPQNDWDYTPNLEKYTPNFMIHGDDWQYGVQAKYRNKAYRVMAKHGGQIIEIPYTKGVNSSEFIKSLNSIGTTSHIRLKSLRRLIAAKPILRILESHSGLTGLIAENTYVMNNGRRVEYDGMWSSSLTDSTSRGKPDIEAVDITTRMQGLTDTLECTTKPIIYDGDTGGKIEHFVFTVRTLERNGISAVIIEDKIGLKKNSLFGTSVPQTQDTIEHFQNKIKEGKRAQVTDDFMIIARIESFILGKTHDDAIKRAHAYVLAGADGIMIHSKEKSGEEILKFTRAFRQSDESTPIVIVPSTFNHIREEEFLKVGVNIVIYANHMLRASYPAMLGVATQILKDGMSLKASERCLSIKEILELIPGTK
jgi:phosphoenolpyruvate phosphomutase / 2-hydroxyethylphosphonate cytidylyltransferase